MLYISVSWAAPRRFCIITPAGWRVKTSFVLPGYYHTFSPFGIGQRGAIVPPWPGKDKYFSENPSSVNYFPPHLL